MPKRLNDFRQQTMREMILLMNDMNRLTSSQGFRDSLNLGLTDQIMSANKAALTLGQTLQKSVNPLTGNLNLTAFNNELKRSSMTLTDYSKQLSQLGSVGQESFKSLTKAIISAETPLTAGSKLAQEMGVVIGNTMRWQAASSAIHGVLNTASQAVNYVRSLDSSLNDIRIVTGQSEEQMERFARQANQAAKELNTTTNQYAKASLIYYQQGLSDKQVADRTETTIKLANVSGQTAKTVSDQMTAIWNNFYNGSKSLEYYADVITALGATTASSSEEIAKGLSKFSSIAQTTGLSYEYATSALSTVVAATRQSADSVGTSFKTLFSRLQGLNLGQTLDDGTTLNKYSKALLTAGVNIKTTSGDLKDMDTILSELSEKWKNLGDAEQVALAQTVGGARNYSTFMALMNNWDDFTTNLQTVQGAQGTLQKQADIYADSWAAASAHVRASAESIYSNLVDDKAFKGMINGFGDVLDIAGKATDTMGGFGGILTQVAAIATRAFGPQLSEGLSNLGYSAMNLLPGGMARVESLRQEAIDNLLNQSNLSSLEKDYAKNFAQRNTTYLEGIKSGVISPANQAMLQSMMGHLDILESSAIDANNMARASEQALNDSIRSTVQTANRINGNSKLDTDMKALQQEIGELRTVQRNVEPDSQRYNMLEKQISQKSNEYELLSKQRNDYYAAAGGRSYINQNTHTLNYANYGQAIKAYGTAYFEQGQLNKLGDIFGGADGWKADQIKETVSSLQRLITIGNGQGKSLSEMTTKGIYGERADDIKKSIAAMEAEFKQMTANGSNPTEAQMRTFLGNYRDTLGLLSTGSIDEAGNLREELTRVFQHSGFKEEVAKDMAAAAATAEARARAQEEDATVKQSQAGLSKIFENVKNDKTSIAQGLVRDTSSIAGVASSIVSISNAMKVFNDEASTSMDKLGAFAGAMMTMPMGITGGANLLKDVASLIPGTAIAGASPVAGAIALGAAAIAGGAAFIHHQNEQIREAQYGTQLQGVTDSVASYGQYTSAITELSDSFAAQDNNYLSNLNQLSQYAEGTREYQQALTATNQSALDLINNYGLGIDSYNVSNGVVQLDSTIVEARKQQLEDLAQRATENGLIASAFTSALSLSDEAYKKTQGEALRAEYTGELSYSSIQDEMVELEKQVYSKGKKVSDEEKAQLELNKYNLEKSYQEAIESQAKTYTYAELADLYVERKEAFEAANPGQKFTMAQFEKQLQQGFYNGQTTGSYAFRLYDVADARAGEKASKDRNLGFDTTGFITKMLQQDFGTDQITSVEKAGEFLLNLHQQTEDINLLKDRANAEVANLFGLAAGFEETDNIYSKLSAQILAKQTSFEDVNNLAGGTLPDTLKEISELTGNALYERYRKDIDENATNAMLSQYSDEVLQSALSGEVMRDLADQILQKQNEQLASIPGLTEELLKSYNNLNSLNGDSVSKLLSDISQLDNKYQNQQSQIAKELLSQLGSEDDELGYNGKNYTRQQLEDIAAGSSIFNDEMSSILGQVQEILTTSALQDLAKTDNQLLTSLYGSINNEDLRSLLGGQEVTDSALLETLARGMSSNDKQTLANYVTAFGSQFGSDMAAEVLRGLVQEGVTVHDLGTGENYNNKYIDRNYLNVLNRLDTTNAISTLYSAEQQSKLLGQNNEYGKRLNDLVEKGFESIGGEVGFFKSLWNSGEFSGLFSKLTSDASMVSMINAEVIDKAANKMDILNQALNTDISNLNSAGLASIMQEVAKGTISQGNITESVIDAMSAAGYGDSTRVEALENIAELSDYSDSSISVIEKAFANQGKAFTGSFYQNQFWDQPLQEVLQQLPTGIESKYRELLINAQQTGQSSKDFQRTIKNEMPEFYKYITTVGTKKGDISNVLQFWKDIGMFSPGEKTGLNNLMMYDPSTGFFGFNPEAIGTSIPEARELGIDAWTRTLEQTETEQALMKELDRMGVLEEMLVKNEDGTIKEYGEPGAGEHHIEANIDTEKQARNLMLAEAHLNGFFAGKSDEEIIQQYIDPAILYMREQAGMGAIWDSGEAIEGVKELQEGGRLTSAEAVRAFFNQYGSKILDENGKQMFEPGDKGYEDFLAKYFPNANTTLSNLRQGVFATDDYKNGVTQGQFTAAAGNGLTFDDWLKGQSDVYNKETGAINYDAAMEAMRQSGWFANDAQMASLLKDYGNTQLEAGTNGQRITATIRDMYGRQQQITLGEGKYQTIDDFQKAIEDSANITDADIQAANAQRSQMDSMLINQAMQAGDQSKAASILMGLSDQGRQVFGQYANYLGLGEAWQTAETRSSAQYQQNALQKGTQNLFEQATYNPRDPTKPNMEGTVDINGTSVSAMQLDRIVKAVQNIDGTTEAALELQNALNELVGEDETNPLTGTKGKVSVDEEGNIYDKEGNLIEFDENGKPVTQNNSGGSNGGDNGNQPGGSPTTGPGNNSSNSSNSSSDSNGKNAAQKFQDYVAGGGTVKAGDTVKDPATGEEYTARKDQDGGWTLYDKEGNEVGTDAPGTITLAAASGQNNNLIPHFAAGVGTIAVTGELGPELHVKPNGDMDLLGKHGREYAWVEPNDKIYTAAQTASILGSKKIKEMISAHAAGINNFIPGYGGGSFGTSFDTSIGTLGSPSGGNGRDFGGGGRSIGGGGIGATEADLSAENHRFDANWIKYRDVLERYYTILQQLEDLSIELQRFATLADRAWGRTRIDNIEKTIDVQEQQVVAQRAYLSEINTYLKEDKQQVTDTVKQFADQWKELYPNRPLTFDGATFDENGVLTNYRQIVETMLDAYNMDVSGYGYASGNYSVGAAGQGGSGLYSTIAGAVAQGVAAGMQGVMGASVGRGSGKYMVTGFASGQNNTDAQTTIQSLSYKTQQNPQQTILEEQLKDIQFYTQTLNLYQQQLTVLEQMEQQLFDTRLQAIQVEVDYKVSIKNNALNLLDYALSKVKDDAYMAAEAVSLIGQEQDINISILEDYEQELKDMLNLNLNGEQFFGSDDYKLVPTMDLSQIEKDLKKLDAMHKKFWDEETQSYRDHYIENTETGEITFENEEEEKEKSKNKNKNSYALFDSIGNSGIGSSLEIDGITKQEDEKFKRHSINEYSSLVARMYEKYYANYSQYLPNPEEFLNYTNSKKRLEALKKQEEAAKAAASSGNVWSMGGAGGKQVGYEVGGIPAGVSVTSVSGGIGRGTLIGGKASGGGTGGSGNDLPDYLYIIKNAGDAVDQLSKLSDLLNSHTIHADIDKFTSKFKNMGEVSNQLQDIFDGLIDDFPKLGESIQNTNSDLIHFDASAKKWLLDIDSYAEAMEVLKQINKTNRQKLTDEKFEQFKEDPMAFWEWMTDMSENFDFTNFTANEIQMLNQLSTTYLSSIANLKNSVLTQIDYLGNSVKTYAKDMDTVFNEFDHYKNLYADWQNIIDLTGRQATKLSHDLIVELNTNVVDNSINKLKSAREQLDAMAHMQKLAQAQYLQAQAELEAFQGDDEQRYWLQNIVDEYRANIDKINKETEEAEDAYMKSWEDALQGLTAAFQQAIKDAAAGFEESFSPIYHTFDALAGALERQKNLRDLYLRPYDQAHGLSQMARDIKDSILDTDNLNSKRELKKLLDEVNDAQEEGVELSAYDLDIMQKKYDLELARAALEDAKNAKSLVRLARDNNGNWSYVYTANEDDVDEAEQRYEDAILAMEQANENYIDSLQDQLLQVLSNAEAQIAALNPSDFANEAEYFDRVKEIQDLANAQVAFIQEQMENAFANNNYLLDNVSGKAADIIKDLTTSYDNTLLAMLTSSDSIGSLAALSVDNIGTLADKAMQAYNDFWTRNAEVWKEAGHDITEASAAISGAMDTISQDSINNVDEMSKVVDRAVNAFDRLNQVLVINAGKIYDVVANYETLATSINKIIELSGEYIKKNTLTIDTNIHSWSQLEDIYSKLATDGSVWIKYLDQNNEEQVKFLEAGTKDTMDWLQSQREQLVKLLQHEVASQVIFDSQKEIDKFMKDLTSTIKDKGLVKLDVKGDLFNKIIGVNETNKDIYNHWMTGTLDSYATTVFGGKEKMKESLSTENRAIMEFFENLNKLAKENGDYKPDQTGVIKLDWVNDKSNVNHILELLKALLEIKKEEAHKFSGGSDSGEDWYQKVMTTNWNHGNLGDFTSLFGGPPGSGSSAQPTQIDTGGYTGRWQFADTGMYTGEWPNGSVRRNGRLAWLHQKELVLNAHDTENFLDAMEIVRQLDNLTNWMANGLGVLAPTNVEPDEEILQQEVHITAEFPNATNHFEIEEAFNNLNNLASQYVHRK